MVRLNATQIQKTSNLLVSYNAVKSVSSMCIDYHFKHFGYFYEKFVLHKT